MLVEFVTPAHSGSRPVFINPKNVTAVGYYGTDSDGEATSVWVHGSPYPMIVLGRVREVADKLNQVEKS